MLRTPKTSFALIFKSLFISDLLSGHASPFLYELSVSCESYQCLGPWLSFSLNRVTLVRFCFGTILSCLSLFIQIALCQSNTSPVGSFTTMIQPGETQTFLDFPFACLTAQ